MRILGFTPRQTGVFLSALMLFAGSACFWILHSREQAYQGKSLSVWLRHLNEGDTAERQAAVEALRGMEKQAVPALVARLEPRDGRLRDRLIWLSRHWPKIRLSPKERYISVEVERGYAANGLGVIGPPASAAIPALLTASLDTNSFCAARAKAALIRIRGDPMDSFLLSPAETRNLTNWLQMAEILLALGSNIQASAEHVATSIGTNRAQRFQIVEDLGRNNREPNAAVALLQGLLTDDEPGIRGNALNMLIMQRAFAYAARQDILLRTNDSDAGVRANARFALLFAFPETGPSEMPCEIAEPKAIQPTGSR